METTTKTNKSARKWNLAQNITNLKNKEEMQQPQKLDPKVPASSWSKDYDNDMQNRRSLG